MTEFIDLSHSGERPKPDAEVINDKLQEIGVTLELQRLNGRKLAAYRKGQVAKSVGMMRISPYYEDAGRDAAWFAGYDGKKEPTLDAILAPVLES